MHGIYNGYFLFQRKTLINIKNFFITMDESKTINQRQREEFIDFWVDYIKTHPDERWSRQQNLLINSVLKSVRHSQQKKFEQ